MHERINEDGPICRECGQYTERVGSFSLCPVLRCDRFAIPVNDDGLTEAEQVAQSEQQADGSSDLRLVPLPEDDDEIEKEREGSDQMGQTSYYSSEAMDAARRIGH